MAVITDNETGNVFDLNGNIPIGIEKFSPFELTIGEVSLPLKLPYTNKNIMTLGWPNRIEGLFKKKTQRSVLVTNSFFQRKAELTLVRVEEGKYIEVVIVFEISVFYKKAHNTQMPKVFNVTRNDFPSVEKWVEHLGKVMTGYATDDFFVFEVLCTDSISDRKYAKLNEIEYRWNADLANEVNLGLLKRINQTGMWIEFKGELVFVYLLPGHNITPFLKISYVLEKIFNYFGYEFDDQELTSNPHYPFLAVLNNTADAIVSTPLKYDILVPTSSVAEFLKAAAVILGCGFSFIGKTAKAVLYKNHLDPKHNSQYTDFSNFIAQKPTIIYNNQKSLKLSANTAGDSLEFNVPFDQLSTPPDTFENMGYQYTLRVWTQFETDIGIRQILYQQPEVCGRISYCLSSNFTWPATTELYKNYGLRYSSESDVIDSVKLSHFNGFNNTRKAHFSKIITPFIQSLSSEYVVGTFPNSQSLSSPHLALRDIVQNLLNEDLNDYYNDLLPKAHIGDVRRLNSRISLEESKDNSVPECPIMFAYYRKGVLERNAQSGGINYIVCFYGSSTHTDILLTDDGLGQYSEQSLSFDGWRGIYYTYYRELSRVLEKSNLEIKVTLNLPITELDYVDTGKPVLIYGQPCQPISLRYELRPLEIKVIEALFRTIRDYPSEDEINISELNQQILNQE